MRWLNSCKFDKLHPAMVLALIRAEEIYVQQGSEMWITSVNDKLHVEKSKHYDGRAVDLRSHVLVNPDLVAMYIQNAVGPQFTVLFEDKNTPNAHIHVQFNGD